MLTVTLSAMCQHRALGLGSRQPGLPGPDGLWGTPIHTLELRLQILFQSPDTTFPPPAPSFSADATPGSWARGPQCLLLPRPSSSRVAGSSTGRRCPRLVGLWWGWRILTRQRVPSVAPTHHGAEHTSFFFLFVCFNTERIRF